MVYGPQTGVCRVCGELTDAFSNAACMRCGGAYHLALRQDVPGKDCGQVWINEEHQTLEFACNLCLGVAEPTAARAAPADGSRRYARREGVSAAEIARRRRRRP